MTIFAQAKDPVPLQIVRGKDFEKKFALVDSAGVAVNLTGYTALCHIRATKCNDTVLIELSTTNGRIALGGVAGTITLLIENAATSTLTEDHAVYSVELTDASSKISPSVAWGSVEITKDNTRP
jgi:Tfp pilus assembly protein PilV